MSEPALSVVVLSWNTADLTLACLRALAAETPRHAREVIVVDNNSVDGSVSEIRQKFPWVRIIENKDEDRNNAEGNTFQLDLKQVVHKEESAQ